jgi:hypothetical protein
MCLVCKLRRESSRRIVGDRLFAIRNNRFDRNSDYPQGKADAQARILLSLFVGSPVS